MPLAVSTEARLSDLLAPVAADSPCGVVDEVANAQIDRLLERLKRRPAAVRVTDGEVAIVRSEESPPWAMLERVAKGLFIGGRIPDLRLKNPADGDVVVGPCKHLGAAFALAYIGLNTDGLEGLARGLDLMAGLVTRYWDSVHPTIDVADAEDPFLSRFRLLTPLAFELPGAATSAGSSIAEDSWRIYDQILKCPLFTEGGNGQLTVRDVLLPWSAELRLPLPRGSDITADRVLRARDAAGSSLLSVRQVLETACAATKAMDEVISAAPGALGKPSFEVLRRVLQSIAGVLERSVGDTQPRKPVVKSNNGGSGKVMDVHVAELVSSREDAIRQLASIAEFFRRSEPSSPIPQLLDRACRLAGKDFLSLVNDLGLGDQALKEYRRLAGIREVADAAKEPGSE